MKFSADRGTLMNTLAKAQGIPVIDYDRLNLGGVSDYYVSFDNEKVGALQGQGLVQGIGDKHVMLEMQNVQLVPVEDETYKVIVGYSEEELENMQSVDESPMN